MKASLNLDQWADVSSMPQENLHLLKWKTGANSLKEPVQIPYFPAGSVFEGEQCLRLCKTGQATPADDECMDALGLTPEQCQTLAVEYEMNSLGIWDKQDRELFRAGVIVGYHEDGTAKPGPNWEAYNAALKDTKPQGEI